MYYQHSSIGQEYCPTLALKGDQIVKLNEFRRLMNPAMRVCQQSGCSNDRQVRQILSNLNLTSEKIAKSWQSNFPDNNQAIASQIGVPVYFLAQEKLLWAPRSVAEAINIFFNLPVYKLEQEFSAIRYVGYCFRGGDFFGVEPNPVVSQPPDVFRRGGVVRTLPFETRNTGDIFRNTLPFETRNTSQVIRNFPPTVQTSGHYPYFVRRYWR